MGGRIELAGSFRPTPSSGLEVPRGNERLKVTVHLKHPDEPRHPPGSAEDFARLRRVTTRKKLAIERARLFAPARDLFKEFAVSHGLKLGPFRHARRTVTISGTVAQMQAAFGADLRLGWQEGQRTAFVRTGALLLPDAVAPWTRAVLGFDAGSRRLQPQSAAGDGAPGLWPSNIAQLYGFPPRSDATGQCIGIIAQGGAYRPEDIAQAASQSGFPVPTIAFKSESGGPFGANPAADRELALDLQVLAGIAPNAKLVIYSAANGTAGLAQALHDAIFDPVNRPHVLSLCWGSSEDTWHDDVRDAVESALSDAVTLNVAVVVASGDYLATGGMMDGSAHVFYPASSPYVLACGGTAFQLDAEGGKIGEEEVWNDDMQQLGSGGGISGKCPVPDYQTGLTLPPSANTGAGPGRGVPDVAAMASKTPGYRVILDGKLLAVPGTSGATPLWAALLTLANAQRTAPLGFPNHALYRNTHLFRAITNGDNKLNDVGYDAGAPWNACTGLGVPADAGEIIRALASA